MKKLIVILLFSSVVSGAVFYNSFNSGQMDKDLQTRLDLEKRDYGVETLENMLIRPQGMAYRRPGTSYIADANSTDDVRLIAFEYSTDDAYAMEFGHGYIRFFRTASDVSGSEHEETPSGVEYLTNPDGTYLLNPDGTKLEMI